MTLMIEVGGSLPRRSFPQVNTPGTVSWNQGTLASVIFVPHRAPCPDCVRYLDQLGDAVTGLREWGARTTVLVAPGSDGTAPAGVLALADEDGAGRALLGVGDDQAAVVQSDRWGAVYDVAGVEEGGSHADLPTPGDLVALAQFIDIQCPECGVPSKEWLAASPFPLG
jgi:hypothetical protein